MSLASSMLQCILYSAKHAALPRSFYCHSPKVTYITHQKGFPCDLQLQMRTGPVPQLYK